MKYSLNNANDNSSFDLLTNCYNKIHLEEVITNRLSNCLHSSALLHIDITEFKLFNERKGYFYGDEMLKQLSNRIKTWGLDTDIVGRIGADEFVLFTCEAENRHDFEARLDVLIKQLNDTYNIFGDNVKICVNVGVSMCHKNNLDYEKCMLLASKALAIAKLSPKGKWLFYDESYESKGYYEKLLQEKIKKSEKISGLNLDHELVSSVINLLHERSNDKEAINSALRYIGQKYKASRCFIIETFDGGDTYCFTHEWCRRNIESHLNTIGVMHNDLLINIFDNALDNGMHICENVDEYNFKDEFLDIFKNKRTISFLCSQIKKEDAVTFFIGVEDCEKTRNWSSLEINTLYFMAKIFYIIMQEKQLNEEVKSLSKHSQISAFIGDNTDNVILIVDPETYDILHMNKKSIEMHGNPSEAEWREKKCYELLHNFSKPCAFCPNHLLTENEFYEWKYFNPRFNRTYIHKDKFVSIDNKLVKLQVATDITILESLETELQSKFEVQSLLLDCIKMLHTQDVPDVSIEKILSIVCNYFEATRGGIIQSARNSSFVNNTHEWVDQHTKSKIHMLQNIPIDVIQPYFDKFGMEGAKYTPDVEESFNRDEKLKALFYNQGITSIMSAPIVNASNTFIGLLCVENPKKNLDKHWLLGSLSMFVSDFLEKSNLVDTLNRLSYYDTLTGVKNRHSYRKALKEIGESKLESLGVAYIDVSDLSGIIEEKGTRYADEIIKRMSFVLSEVFEDNIYHIGRDEFVVLEKNIEEAVFEGKISILKDAIFEEPELNASIGFTWNTDFESENNEEHGSYNTVRDSRNYTAMLSKNLDNEIKSNKFEVFLQPQFNLVTKKLEGAEALIRRFDASGNLQSPASFVPFYEKEGMMSKLDFYVFETMCKLLSDWEKRKIGSNVKISVNCSRTTIMEKDIVAKLSKLCSNYKVSKDKIIVEITETINQSDDKVFSYIVSSLKNSGFSVSLDDFGSGYSNLSSLKISDFDEIKIDMGLTRDVHLDEKSKILTKVALNLCNEFKEMVSVAEGIENVEQFNILREMNCQKGQGYYFSKPISIDDFEKKYFSNDTKLFDI